MKKGRYIVMKVGQKVLRRADPTTHVDGKCGTMVGTISKARPDLFSQRGGIYYVLWASGYEGRHEGRTLKAIEDQ